MVFGMEPVTCGSEAGSGQQVCSDIGNWEKYCYNFVIQGSSTKFLQYFSRLSNSVSL